MPVSLSFLESSSSSTGFSEHFTLHPSSMFAQSPLDRLLHLQANLSSQSMFSIITLLFDNICQVLDAWPCAGHCVHSFSPYNNPRKEIPYLFPFGWITEAWTQRVTITRHLCHLVGFRTRLHLKKGFHCYGKLGKLLRSNCLFKKYNWQIIYLFQVHNTIW